MTEKQAAARVSVRRRGFRCEVRMGELSVLVPHRRGLQYLAVLTANAEQDIAAVTLVSGALAGDWTGAAPSAAQPVLDDAARRRYRQRLSELDAAITASETAGDTARYDALTGERQWLLRELATAAGFGGRTRGFATDEERARVAVGKAIRRAIDHIGRDAPAIGEHLRRRVHTGRYCAYLPIR
jgi:hypothetical protein